MNKLEHQQTNKGKLTRVRTVRLYSKQNRILERNTAMNRTYIEVVGIEHQRDTGGEDFPVQKTVPGIVCTLLLVQRQTLRAIRRVGDLVNTRSRYVLLGDIFILPGRRVVQTNCWRGPGVGGS